MNSELSKISQITDQIFISGIFPLDSTEDDLIKKNGIKFILCCVDRSYMEDTHNKVMMNNPNVIILYLPYDDDIDQNLWKINQNQIKVIKYTNSTEDYNKLVNLIQLYNNKPMIEIGYHFINNVLINNNKILVHCMAGISRSVSLVTYFLMKKYHISYDEAISIIKNKRPIANPNNSFKNQLINYHKKKDKFTEKHADNVINDIKK
jgi:protein tyrosine phosphatase